MLKKIPGMCPNIEQRHRDCSNGEHMKKIMLILVAMIWLVPMTAWGANSDHSALLDAKLDEGFLQTVMSASTDRLWE